MDPLTIPEIALRLIVAICLGGLVGLERERKHRPAGFRTMILISLGSAAFLMVGIEAIAEVGRQLHQELPQGQQGIITTGQAEISRVLQGLIGGIGFLGAGAVIQNKKAVRGLTTAAAVWCTAALGAACGLGLFKLAGLVATGALFTLVVLEIFEERYFPEPFEEKSDPGKDVIRIVLDRDGHPLDPKE